MPSFKHIRVEGSPAERGLQYGQQGRQLVRGAIDFYARLFWHYAGLDWRAACREALRFESAILSFAPHLLEEVAGIARGAAVDYESVLALNVRTELMFSGRSRRIAARIHECSSFALAPAATAGECALMGQNWDWLVGCSGFVVVLEAVQQGGASFVTVVEAGLLAKAGLNSHGLGVATNALVSDADSGVAAVPYHVMLRALLDADSIESALALLRGSQRSSSANYLIGHAAGGALDVEAAAGGADRLYVLPAADGVLAHTNHFVAPMLDVVDLSPSAMPTTNSPGRYARLRHLLSSSRGALTPDGLQTILRDHENYPHGLCSHIDGSKPVDEQTETIASMIFDLAARRLWLAAGQPCRVPHRALDCSSLQAGSCGPTCK